MKGRLFGAVVLALALGLLSTLARAGAGVQTNFYGYGNRIPAIVGQDGSGNVAPGMMPVDPSGAPLGVTANPLAASPKPATGTGAYAPVTVGTTDGIVAVSPTVFLDLRNVSNTGTICLNFGAPATITGTQCAAGEISLPPGWHQSWETSFVPTDTIHAIASAAGTQLTVGAK